MIFLIFFCQFKFHLPTEPLGVSNGFGIFMDQLLLGGMESLHEWGEIWWKRLIIFYWYSTVFGLDDLNLHSIICWFIYVHNFVFSFQFASLYISSANNKLFWWTWPVLSLLVDGDFQAECLPCVKKIYIRFRNDIVYCRTCCCCCCCEPTSVRVASRPLLSWWPSWLIVELPRLVITICVVCRVPQLFGCQWILEK